MPELYNPQQGGTKSRQQPGPMPKVYKIAVLVVKGIKDVGPVLNVRNMANVDRPLASLDLLILP